MVNMCGQISRGIGHNCPPSIFQLAVAQVLDKTADLSVYETNMNLIYNCLMELGFTCVKPGGTFYIFPKAQEEEAKVFCEKALKYDLVLVPADSYDYLFTAEAKSIPIIHEMARQTGAKKYFIARKGKKAYMPDPLCVEDQSITTFGELAAFIESKLN